MDVHKEITLLLSLVHHLEGFFSIDDSLSFLESISVLAFCFGVVNFVFIV